MIPALLQRVKDAGHAIFEKNTYNLNIIGIRSASRTAGSFDDLICCVYRDQTWEWRVHEWAATTDPGAYYLARPLRPQGAAIMLPGQYRLSYALGEHHGYPALQQCRPIRFVRDNNRDGHLDLDGPVENAIIGANLHCADPDPWRAGARNPGFGSDIDKWSAGCQVLANSADYRRLIDLCRISALRYGPRFTYTLIED